jgi:hypothetical protein
LVLALPVHGAQFNGKQEGKATTAPPNLRCPRNGKQTGFGASQNPAFISNHWWL